MEQVTSGQMEKAICLKNYLKELHTVAIAFSGGVDSAFLLKAAVDALGDRVIAVTAASCLVPKRELDEATAFCEKEGIRHFVFESEELKIDGFAQNPVNRCYLCKKELLKKIKMIAEENGMAYVAEGSNLDDSSDYRPGFQAVTELGIKSPLRECGMTKTDIRELSRYLGLPTWKKQSFACLASRFAYGEMITEEKLIMVDRAEQLLLDMGFHRVRVRVHGRMARIELEPDAFWKLMEPENRKMVIEKFKTYGFMYIAMIEREA